MRTIWATGAALLTILATGFPLTARATAGERVELARIRAAIRRQGLAWTAAPTRISRMPWAARRRYRRSPVPATLRSRFLGNHPRSRRATPTRASLEAAVDWRAREGFNWVTPIRDQGRCGACWAFATVAAVESLVAWRRSTPDPEIDLSEQHLLDCANASLSCDSGGVTWDLPFIGGAGTFFQQTGLTSETCYPYTSGDSGTKGLCSPPAGACAADSLRVDDLEEIASTLPGWPLWDPPPFELSAEAMNELKAHLAERPVGTSMRTFADLDYYSGGVYEPSSTSGASGLHAVLIVGYDDAGGYWIVKNSWGADWGEDGFFRIRYGTSSLGMFSFVYRVDEDRKEPSFCGDLPRGITLPARTAGTRAPLVLRNCGSGVLHWSATVDEAWLALEDEHQAVVTSGNEVAAGTQYQIRIVSEAPPGARASLALTAPQGSFSILVQVPGEAADAGPPADGGIAADAGPPADGGPPADAGPSTDAGPPADAGPFTDAGMPTDAGALTDAGSSVPGDGPPAATSGGCAASAGRPPAPWLLIPCLMGLLVQGRKRRKS